MAHIADHLSVKELGRHARTRARLYQAVWLLAQGQTVSEVAVVISFVSRWLEQQAHRDNQSGPNTLGGRRGHNGTSGRLLTYELLDRLRTRLEMPPPHGGPGTTTKIAAWMAQDLALLRFIRNGLGTRCRRSASRSRRCVPRSRWPPALKSRPLSKKMRRPPR